MKYFEILGITKTWYGIASKIYPEQIQIDHHGKESKVTKLNDGAVLLHSKVPYVWKSGGCLPCSSVTMARDDDHVQYW